MDTPTLHAIRSSLEGAVPAIMATCAADGTPNVAYISQVYYVDERHVALSFQFFNKTHHNIRANPLASVLLLDPLTGRFHRLRLRYLRTETEGALFESMRAQLAGIASHAGMGGVFRLLGSDVYEVLQIEAIEGDTLTPPPPRTGLLNAARRASERMSRCTALDELLDAALAALADHADVRHAMVLLRDRAASGPERLYTVASCGYPTSGVGSEIEFDHGVIGVAARACTPVRINHMTQASLYSHAVRERLRADTPSLALELATDIPFPGLAEPHSQMAVPIVAAGQMLGVLFVESPDDMQFSFEDEDLLLTIAGHLGAAIEHLKAPDEAHVAEPVSPPPPAPAQAPLQVRRFGSNNSVFIGDTYLIKGVAGAIFWKLLRDHTRQGRVDFSNRELRLDPALRLPDVADNLEARLLLLQRRLQEQSPHIRIEKTGRGRFRLCVARAIELVDVEC